MGARTCTSVASVTWAGLKVFLGRRVLRGRGRTAPPAAAADGAAWGRVGPGAEGERQRARRAPRGRPLLRMRPSFVIRTSTSDRVRGPLRGGSAEYTWGIPHPCLFPSKPPSDTLRPPSVTLQPPSITLQPSSVARKPPSATLQPPSATLQPLGMDFPKRDRNGAVVSRQNHMRGILGSLSVLNLFSNCEWASIGGTLLCIRAGA